jgi:hypothetical protein
MVIQKHMMGKFYFKKRQVADFTATI